METKQKEYSAAFMCRVLEVSRSGYYKFLKNKSKPYKYATLLARIKEILEEDKENREYGVVRMYQALKYKFNIKESQTTVGRVMRENGLTHKKKRNPLSLTKADKEAQKADDLLRRDFKAERPNEKAVTDITQLPTAEGRLYISGIFDCFDNYCLGLSMDDNMRKELVIDTIMQIRIKNIIIHSDRGKQYTSEEYKKTMKYFKMKQSMNSAGGRCHDNAKCESMWARFKEELIYGKIETSKMTMNEVKQIVFRYFMGYWNNRRICSSIGGVPPVYKRAKYYEQLKMAA